jgi:hypothetical protein
MKKHIVTLMNEGISLDQIQSEVEKIFNEEYKKREEEQEKAKRFAEVNAALDRASAAVVDFINGYVGEEVMTVEECKDTLKDTAVKIKMMNKCAEKITVKVDNDEDEQKLVDFLASLGLIQLK